MGALVRYGQGGLCAPGFVPGRVGTAELEAALAPQNHRIIRRTCPVSQKNSNDARCNRKADLFDLFT